jgi:hypothetical protein
VDLHEITDMDAAEYMPAIHAKVGLPYEKRSFRTDFTWWVILWSLISTFCKPSNESVQKATYIVPSDDEGNLIGEPAVKEGVNLIPVKQLDLCGSV